MFGADLTQPSEASNLGLKTIENWWTNETNRHFLFHCSHWSTHFFHCSNIRDFLFCGCCKHKDLSPFFSEVAQKWCLSSQQFTNWSCQLSIWVDTPRTSKPFVWQNHWVESRKNEMLTFWQLTKFWCSEACCQFGQANWNVMHHDFSETNKQNCRSQNLHWLSFLLFWIQFSMSMLEGLQWHATMLQTQKVVWIDKSCTSLCHNFCHDVCHNFYTTFCNFGKVTLWVWSSTRHGHESWEREMRSPSHGQQWNIGWSCVERAVKQHLKLSGRVIAQWKCEKTKNSTTTPSSVSHSDNWHVRRWLINTLLTLCSLHNAWGRTQCTDLHARNWLAKTSHCHETCRVKWRAETRPSHGFCPLLARRPAEFVTVTLLCTTATFPHMIFGYNVRVAFYSSVIVGLQHGVAQHDAVIYCCKDGNAESLPSMAGGRWCRLLPSMAADSNGAATVPGAILYYSIAAVAQ